MIPVLNVTDNLFVGFHRKKKYGLLDWPYIKKRAKEIIYMMHQDVGPETLCGVIGMGQCQTTEIGKAILHQYRVIILVKPISSMGETAVKELFKIQ